MAKPVHRREVRRFVVGIGTLAVLGVIGFIGMKVQGGGELAGKPYTYVTAAFRDAGTLEAREDIKQNGVDVGTVAGMRYENGMAIVSLRLNGTRPIYRNAQAKLGTMRARLGNESALGRQFIEFDPGNPKSGPLPGHYIPVSDTGQAGAVNDVFTAFDPPTRQALGSSLRELGGGMIGRGEDLHDALHAAPGLLGDAGRVSGALTGPGADVPGVLQSANRLVGRFDGRQQQISSMIRQLDGTLSAVNVDNDEPLNESLGKLPATLRQAQQGLNTLNRPLSDVDAALRTAAPGARSLGNATPDLRGVLREGVRPLDELPGIAGDAQPAVQELTHTFADARPLAPRLARTVTEGNLLLNSLSPYAKDIGMLLSSHGLLSGRVAPYQHYFSATLAAPGLFNASLPDPLYPKRDPYPAPGGGGWAHTPSSDLPGQAPGEGLDARHAGGIK